MNYNQWFSRVNSHWWRCSSQTISPSWTKTSLRRSIKSLTLPTPLSKNSLLLLLTSTKNPQKNHQLILPGPEEPKVRKPSIPTKSSDIGLLRRTNGIIGSCKFTTTIFWINICGEWTKYSRPWLSSWAPGRPNSVEATTKKCKKNIKPSPRFFSICANTTTRQKTRSYWLRTSTEIL